ncbi:MAG: hypothetical protein ACU0DW_13350 [Shimia sp.]
MLRPVTEADDAAIIAAHQRLYAEGYGFDATFGAVVARVLFAFRASPGRGAGWVVDNGAVRGSIFCMVDAGTRARLRLF